MHFEDDKKTFCVKNRKIYGNVMSDENFPVYFCNKT